MIAPIAPWAYDIVPLSGGRGKQLWAGSFLDEIEWRMEWEGKGSDRSQTNQSNKQWNLWATRQDNDHTHSQRWERAIGRTP